MKVNRLAKRCAALMMVMVLTFLLPGNYLAAHKVFAAGDSTLYVKEFKLFIEKGASKNDAQKWCDSLPENKDSDSLNNWHAVEYNLNEGAGAAVKSAKGVYLCYQTTTDVNEAVTDIAVMNERGNYDIGTYDMILDQKKEFFTDMVTNMSTMLEEYRTNYKNGVPTAEQAYEVLNMFYEDDSGKKLGDFLLDVDNTTLSNVLLQANGSVLLTMEEQLARACDTGKCTWLDRLVTIKSYDNFLKTIKNKYHYSTKRAEQVLKDTYYQRALELSESWNDIKQHMENMDNYKKKNGIEDMSEEELDEWVETVTSEGAFDDAETRIYIQEFNVISSLVMYEYDGKTLYDFFNQDIENVTGDNIKYLYPVVSSLSEGQFASVNETVSLYTLIESAFNANLNNEYKKGIGKEYADTENEELQAEAEEAKEYQEKALDVAKEVDPVSVYEGVDRDIFKGGVAVTSNAKTFSSGVEKSWAESFVDSGSFKKIGICLTIGAGVSAIGAIGSAVALKFMQVTEQQAHRVFSIIGAPSLHSGAFAEKVAQSVSQSTSVYVRNHTFNQMIKQARIGSYDAVAAKNEICQKALGNTFKYRFVTGLKIGLAVFAILFAVADIVMTVIALCKYYNIEHAPIPHNMVDMTYDENKEVDYVGYSSVQDNQGNNGDVNGDSGKQWLALFSTKDKLAGDPILAPDGKMNNIIVNYGESKNPSGYSPLHMFGTPNAAQNLTYADGENGFSYNDDKGGTYLFFARDTNAFYLDDEDDSAAATSILETKNVVALVVSGVVGLVVGAIIAVPLRRRKKTA